MHSPFPSNKTSSKIFTSAFNNSSQKDIQSPSSNIMAPPTTNDSDFRFIMVCLKHSAEHPKPNFDEVAKETGASSANACYQKHWGIMKKWGLAHNAGKGRKPGAATTPRTAAGTKRGRASANSTPRTPRTKVSKAEDSEEDKDLSAVSDDENDAVEAMPSKKAKGDEHGANGGAEIKDKDEATRSE